MVRVHVVAEGPSEETFVRTHLCPHLGTSQIVIDATAIITSNHRGRVYRGGHVKYGSLRRDVVNWLKQDRQPNVFVSSMVDLYAIPEDFPGYAEGQRINNPYDRTRHLEQSFAKDVGDRRFLPYISLHEFEALLFASPDAWKDESRDRPGVLEAITQIASDAGNPELIDDTPDGAPSRRLITLLPEYAKAKTTISARVLSRVPLEAIRSRCQHFDAWLRQLEGLLPL